MESCEKVPIFHYKWSCKALNLSLAIHFNTSFAFLLHLLQILYKGKLIAMIDKIDQKIFVQRTYIYHKNSTLKKKPMPPFWRQ